MDELKPCPFCGSEDVKACQYNDLYVVLCDSCRAKSVECITAEKAAEFWNRRAKKSEQEQLLPLTVRNSYMLGKIAELNEEIANLRTDLARVTSKNIEYEERETIRKKGVQR